MLSVSWSVPDHLSRRAVSFTSSHCVTCTASQTLLWGARVPAAAPGLAPPAQNTGLGPLSGPLRSSHFWPGISPRPSLAPWDPPVEALNCPRVCRDSSLTPLPALSPLGFHLSYPSLTLSPLIPTTLQGNFLCTWLDKRALPGGPSGEGAGAAHSCPPRPAHGLAGERPSADANECRVCLAFAVFSLGSLSSADDSEMKTSDNLFFFSYFACHRRRHMSCDS